MADDRLREILLRVYKWARQNSTPPNGCINQALSAIKKDYIRRDELNEGTLTAIIGDVFNEPLDSAKCRKVAEKIIDYGNNL
jgi:hypothetical protein